MEQSTRKCILLVDDDRRLTAMLTELLEAEGYSCVAAPNGARGLLLLNEQRPDLVVLDVMMPGADGIETLRTLRETSTVPVIMLTALGENADRIRGLEAGADDYLAKPFVARELLLRIRAILKRVSEDSGQAQEPELLEVGPLRVQMNRQSASVGSAELQLTNTELRVLSALMKKAGSVVTRQYLSQYAIGRELLPYDRTLDTHVSNLRRKITLTGDSRCNIRTVRGSGYRLTVD
ncbi:MAG: response regulator transcription factor [Gammaproteobacteria bacterium]|nr:response regulator transcription factor [Gammaproteobacteria bacterium]MDH5304348.1 response regulator transcription factor [Gammaproteobacteria bacterium]MDH5323723.1 response regulator transcription factor [Gammaproteobacteria bacterium]